LRIVEVPLSELQRTRRRGRVRSEETTALIDAILSLKAGQAKAIELEGEEDPRKIRSKLNYAARIADRKIRVVLEDNRVLFARSRRRTRGRSRGEDSSEG